MNKITCVGLMLTLSSLMLAAMAETAEAGPRILLLTKSAGFEHGVIKHDVGGTSHVERILKPLARDINATLECTKDASGITAEDLEQLDVVIFYTSGNLTEVGEDGHPPMTQAGHDALLAWIRDGGGFIGFHSATDSFKGGAQGPTPYIEMIGGEFVVHGAQFEGKLVNTSPGHPAIASLPEYWMVQEEWYLFRHLNEEKMHVLAMLDPLQEREKQPMYNIPSYPMIWCRDYGAGRVLYNGMGHREDIWEHPLFQALVIEHIQWAAGEGALQTEPNYTDVVPETAPKE